MREREREREKILQLAYSTLHDRLRLMNKKAWINIRIRGVKEVKEFFLQRGFEFQVVMENVQICFLLDVVSCSNSSNEKVGTSRYFFLFGILNWSFSLPQRL